MDTVTETRHTESLSDNLSNKFSVKNLELSSDPADYQQSLIWRNIIVALVIHVIGIYGFIVGIREAKWASFVFILVYSQVTLLGVTAGAHRLWTHRSYSAKMPLRILLATLYYTTTQQPIAHWVLDHKVHHKYSDMAPDPYNAARGFFYSHIGWLLMKKSRLTIKCGQQMDMTMVYGDPVVNFFDKYYAILQPTGAFVIPTLIPVYCWNESWYISLLFVALRFIVLAHMGLSVNSLAHLWGVRPYNKSLTASENPLVSLMVLGEGWHNYHHAFPWDYKTSEFHGYSLNLTTGFIDFMAWLGLAYNLKSAKTELIASAYLNKGDGNKSLFGNQYSHSTD